MVKINTIRFGKVYAADTFQGSTVYLRLAHTLSHSSEPEQLSVLHNVFARRGKNESAKSTFVDDIYPQQCASILFAMLHMNKAANSLVLWYSYNGNWRDWTAIPPSNARVDKICNAEFKTIKISMGFN
ncbi:hypothetical protein QUQ58_004729 [Escherichia coli]|nr:hypothetical protein [Escherichia coli]